MNYMGLLWRYVNLLSLDVVFGAMAGQLFFADVLGVDLPVQSYLLLGMVVWILYTFDHLWDARKVSHQAHGDRHLFHQRYFKALLFSLLAITLSGLLMMTFDKRLHFIFLPGIWLGLPMLFWMGVLRIFEHRLGWLKEVSTGLFYVLGIALAPMVLHSPNYYPSAFYLLGAGYFLLACINLFVLSYMDQRTDNLDGFGSLLQLISRNQLLGLIRWSGMINAFYLGLLLFQQPSYYKIHAGVLLLITLYHLQLSWQKDARLIRQKLEASFLLPWVLLVF